MNMHFKEQYTLMLVGDETSPIRRIQLRGTMLQRAVYAAVAVALIFLVAGYDYYRAKLDNRELSQLRVQSIEQTAEMASVQVALDEMTSQMKKVRELERKVRIIANLPGASSVGGEEISELVPDGSVAADAADADLSVPVGVPVELDGQGGGGLIGIPQDMRPTRAGGVPEYGLVTEKARQMRGLQEIATVIAVRAEIQSGRLEELVSQLDDKHNKLTSMPSIWPTKGWLTSRFGPRISPFTGRRQHHAGIDIAAAMGADVVAPAAGRVVFVGRKGPLGNTVVLEHGFGVRTLYGHAEEIFVKIGEELERGTKLASVGNTGRSTGPHLHYVVEVNGKSRNPLDYIFD